MAAGVERGDELLGERVPQSGGEHRLPGAVDALGVSAGAASVSPRERAGLGRSRPSVSRGRSRSPTAGAPSTLARSRAVGEVEAAFGVRTRADAIAQRAGHQIEEIPRDHRQDVVGRQRGRGHEGPAVCGQYGRRRMMRGEIVDGLDRGARERSPGDPMPDEVVRLPTQLPHPLQIGRGDYGRYRHVRLRQPLEPSRRIHDPLTVTVAPVSVGADEVETQTAAAQLQRGESLSHRPSPSPALPLHR